VDVVLNAIVGAAGLRASVAALEAGKTLALANKESLVAGGEVCRAAADRTGAAILPVDSEHVALAQCLRRRPRGEIRRLIVTASGGPFRERQDLSEVRPEEALAHPTWAMGPKITVDSATLMNKGLEAIEAHHLFDISYDNIDILVQPQSIVHGIVEMTDGSQLMSAATPDMRMAIQSALIEDEAEAETFASLDLGTVGRLDFEPVDRERFPAVDLAYAAGRRGGTFPAVLNAANEIAVRAFLDGKIPFLDIVAVVGEVLAEHPGGDATQLDLVLDADRWARAAAERHVDRRALTPAGGNK
jgi:1-deoxy-D-xylulose-5-phosphate reductoisomerase